MIQLQALAFVFGRSRIRIFAIFSWGIEI